MEGCLKKLVLKAEAMGFGDPWKGGWEPMGASGRKTVPEGLDWKQSGVYSQPPGAKKLIPVRLTLIVFFHFSKLVSKNPSPNETAKKYPGGQPNAKVAAQS